ncbi:acyl-[acyl-carrier-protein] thioesterase [Gordonia sp. (in: high G+C Gram-positive bacteria)]|uniref:acyl-[acyl-carrier-protein] thioesterase n=1 Tax=Gordonia sp. (in: high G+C Gram-positive bacteria) TaxID=84139 RepID=UPI0039E438A5
MTATTPAPEPLAKRKDGAQFFQAQYRIRTGDVDQDMRVRLDSAARYLQDIANDNIDATDLTQSDPFWIVRRTIVDVIRPFSWPGTVTAERWCGAASTRWTNMRVTMTAEHETNLFNPDEREPGLIETEGFWINVNDQGMPSRISDEALELLSSMTDEHRLRWKAMNPEKAPESGSAPDREHVLRATDFDPFKHLNNAAYLEVLEDELLDHPELVAGPHRMIIEYMRPIQPGAKLTIRRLLDEDSLTLWMLMDDDGEQKVAATMSVGPLPDYDEATP